MKKVAYLTAITMLAFSPFTMAENLDDLGEIKLIDESAKSNLYQREKIVGCTDFIEKKELSCAKEPKDAILSKLPTSQQLQQADLEDDNVRKDIKNELSGILAELNKLKKEQQASLATIKRLQGVIDSLSKEKVNNTTEKMAMVKEIKKITPKKKKSYTKTLIRKKIKEISRTDTEVVVEVQSNESLSTYAQAYYNDNTQYYKIYKANEDKIPSNMMIVIGDRLRIPLN
jgi:nucleoid-associated protein YgaU